MTRDLHALSDAYAILSALHNGVSLEVNPVPRQFIWRIMIRVEQAMCACWYDDGGDA